MPLPQHVYGTSKDGEPYAWMVRLHEPFILSWPESENVKTTVELWPKPLLWTPEVHTAIAEFVAQFKYEDRNFKFVAGQSPPRYLYVEEPDGMWTGVLDLWFGSLFVPNALGLLVTVREFHTLAMVLDIPVEPGDALSAAQSWYDEFIVNHSMDVE